MGNRIELEFDEGFAGAFFYARGSDGGQQATGTWIDEPTGGDRLVGCGQTSWREPTGPGDTGPAVIRTRLSPVRQYRAGCGFVHCNPYHIRSGGFG